MKMHIRPALAALAAILLCAAIAAYSADICAARGKAKNKTNPRKVKGGHHRMVLTSPVFKEGAPIPRKYTCDGDDVSPPLSWTGAPGGAAGFALIGDDPDAPMGTWVHWVIFSIPKEDTSLPEAIPPQRTLKNSAKQGMNDFRKIGYGGPCPPSGTHRYFFKLYALDAALKLDPGATKAQLEKAMKSHILAEAKLMGTYKR